MTAKPAPSQPQTRLAQLLALYDKVEARLSKLPPEEYAALQQKVREALAPKGEAAHAAD
jgi:hypothetical protein